MHEDKKLEFEVQSLKATIANCVAAWNKQLAKNGHPTRFEILFDFGTTKDEPTDRNKIIVELPGILGKTHIEKGSVTINSYKKTSPDKKKKLFTYTHDFAPHDFLKGMQNSDYDRCLVLLLQHVLVEAIGVFLQTLNHLVK